MESLFKVVTEVEVVKIDDHGSRRDGEDRGICSKIFHPKSPILPDSAPPTLGEIRRIRIGSSDFRPNPTAYWMIPCSAYRLMDLGGRTGPTMPTSPRHTWHPITTPKVSLWALSVRICIRHWVGFLGCRRTENRTLGQILHHADGYGWDI